jgi:hypothetical protein
MSDDPTRDYLTAVFARQVQKVADELRDAAGRIEQCATPTGNLVTGSENYGKVDYQAAAQRILSIWMNLGPNAGIGQVFSAAADIATYDNTKNRRSTP